MPNEKLPPFIHALLKGDAYPHAAPETKLIQTHISYIILAGEYVYKFKKPVDFGFLDFSDLAKRKYYCEQELLLNRRLCPDIYLGVVTITSLGGTFCLDGEGDVVEYGVKMVRMPEEKMMVNLIQKNRLTRDHIDRLVNVLVPFYEKADRNSDIDAFGTAEAVGRNVMENIDQVRSFVGSNALSQEQFDAILSYARNFLEHKDIFDRRIAHGHICDCHGDLYSANICLADKVYIYDCIEFNKRFRYCDVASDVSFLAMDLDKWGLEELSSYYIDHFVDTLDDPGLLGLLDFYKCYRACVRGKINLLTASDEGVDSEVRYQCKNAAARYFNLAHHYATR